MSVCGQHKLEDTKSCGRGKGVGVGLFEDRGGKYNQNTLYGMLKELAKTILVLILEVE